MKHKTLIAGALGLGALAGAGTWGVIALDGADRTAETRYWRTAEARPTAAPTPPSVPEGELRKLLLPRPYGVRPGPDLGEDGSEYALSGPVAVERIKEERKGMRAAERKQRDRILDRLKLTGTAGRSYLDVNGYAAEVRVIRAEGKGLAEFSRFSERVLKLVAKEGEGKTRKVEGHPEASCVQVALVPADGPEGKKGEGVDSLFCSAYTEGTLVSFEASGAKPFDPKAALGLLADQLDHLKSPGESV
ncbi:hypothetical protein LG634_15330 [Streptomyces bambusae]|uniref:hypothetical protein n=1 Tax=Streptomyces bambusae TaxID=1550616 RepID=UPI001CFCEC38|nr:hypothetical protein [Streptomyces bambusae]MCB5166200.1 hypothetical protein [Streptomyces bambusae]